MARASAYNVFLHSLTLLRYYIYAATRRILSLRLIYEGRQVVELVSDGTS